MYSLIGNLFLKRFFGNRLQGLRVNPDNQAISLPADETNTPDQPAGNAADNPPDMHAALENEQTGILGQAAGTENGSDQAATDDPPPAAEFAEIIGDE